MFVSGATATRLSRPGVAITRSTINSAARWRLGSRDGVGSSIPPSPFSACTSEPVRRRSRNNGLPDPRAAGISARPATSRTISALRVVCSTSTLPKTVVTASTWSSGEHSMTSSAIESSTPGSVSKITRFGICQPSAFSYQPPEKEVPDSLELEQRHGHQGRDSIGHDHVPQHTQPSAAVDDRRLVQLAWDLAEELGEREDHEWTGVPGDDQPRVTVLQPEYSDDQVERDDGCLEWHEHRGDDQDEEDALEWELQPREEVGRHRVEDQRAGHHRAGNRDAVE